MGKAPGTLQTIFVAGPCANLAIKPSKCCVGYTELVFLGHKIGQVGVAPKEDLIGKMREASAPTTKKQLRSCLCLVGYYRSFVPNFATIAVPLSDLTRKGSPNVIVWTDVHETCDLSCDHQVMRSVPLIRCLPKMSPSSSTSNGSQIATWRRSLT